MFIILLLSANGAVVWFCFNRTPQIYREILRTIDIHVHLVIIDTSDFSRKVYCLKLQMQIILFRQFRSITFQRNIYFFKPCKREPLNLLGRSFTI